MRYRINFLVLLPLCAVVCGCTHGAKIIASSGYSGSVQEKIAHYGCPTCHVIPGIPGAVGKVGPSLDSLAQRSYVAGRLPNSEANLQIWIRHPQSIEPGVAMPEMGVTEDDARQIASFLEQSHSSR
jgi:cytochrome c2